MKESYWGYWFILMGVFIVVVMMFTQDATTSTTQDYYQLKEVANKAITKKNIFNFALLSYLITKVLSFTEINNKR